MVNYKGKLSYFSTAVHINSDYGWHGCDFRGRDLLQSPNSKLSTLPDNLQLPITIDCELS